MFRSRNPATGEMLGEWPLHSPAEVDARLDAMVRAQRAWRTRSMEERTAPIAAAGCLLERDVERLARRASDEMGKPIREARAEVQKCAALCQHYATEGPAALGRRVLAPRGGASVRVDPLGVILGIMPWNFPFWQVVRFAVPTLLTGNAVLIKHAPNVGGVAEDLDALWKEAGFPEDLTASLRVAQEDVASWIEDPRIAGVSLTGSERAGRAVGEVAGRALKPMVLELGGSDAFLVFPEADLQRAVDVALQARLQNTGQSCIAAKRFLVHREVADRFVEAMVEGLAAWPQGPPCLEETRLGPLAREDLAAELERQAQGSISSGARLVHGEGRAKGAWFAPVVLADVPTESPAWAEETFGPLIAVRRFETEAEGVHLANASRYGLGASLWGDVERVTRLLPQMEAGVVALNAMVRSDPRVPFGGIKASGLGRELGDEGVVAFANLRTVLHA